MPSLFPSFSALSASFSHAHPYTMNQTTQRTPLQARSELYGAWDVAEDAKNKAKGLSDAAQKELQKASEIAQAKTGKIELYSGKFYAVSDASPNH